MTTVIENLQTVLASVLHRFGTAPFARGPAPHTFRTLLTCADPEPVLGRNTLDDEDEAHPKMEFVV